jgi:hypothetical protein
MKNYYRLNAMELYLELDVFPIRYMFSKEYDNSIGKSIQICCDLENSVVKYKDEYGYKGPNDYYFQLLLNDWYKGIRL